MYYVYQLVVNKTYLLSYLWKEHDYKQEYKGVIPCMSVLCLVELVRAKHITSLQAKIRQGNTTLV